MPDAEKSVLFDGTFEGFLTIIHLHYYDGLNPGYIHEKNSFQQTLGDSYAEVVSDQKKSETVFEALHKKISPGAASTINHAFLFYEPERYINIYRYILLGFKAGADVDLYMKYDYVRYTQKAARYVGCEAHKLCGFCRFTETAQGVLYCKIGPNNDVLAILADHFADRLMNEQWIIHDEKRKTAAVYDGYNFILTDVPDKINVTASENEAGYRKLWHMFFTTIANETRVNYKLQRQVLPLRYRKYMNEFDGAYDLKD